MLEQAVPVERGAICDPMRLAGKESSDRQRDVLGDGARAKRSERAHDVVAARDAVDQAPMDQPRQKVRSGLRRELTELLHVVGCEDFLAFHRKLVKELNVARLRGHDSHIVHAFRVLDNIHLVSPLCYTRETCITSLLCRLSSHWFLNDRSSLRRRPAYAITASSGRSRSGLPEKCRSQGLGAGGL